MSSCQILIKALILCVAGVDCALAFYWELWSFNTMCTEDKGLTFARSNPWNCNHYLVCMSGVTFPGQCPPGLVYSDANQRCQHPLPSDLGRCGRSVMESLEAACHLQRGWKFTSPFSCAQFFECAPHQPAQGLLSADRTSAPSTSSRAGPRDTVPGQGEAQHALQLMECPYPSFYSTATSRCQSFDQVNCGARPQPKAPCDYMQYRQLCEGPHCPPCARRHPSCVGLANGAHVLPGYDNLYILCYMERTFDVRKCNAGFVFSAAQKTCVKATV